MKKKIRVLLLCPNPEDGTSWWRGIGPMVHLRDSNPDLEIEMEYTTDPIGWAKVRFFDVVFFQRPGKLPTFELMALCKTLGKKVWVDYDDNLMDVPFSNPAFKAYASPKMKQNVSKMVQIADVVTVTTMELKKLFDPLNDNVRIVPNALDDQVIAPKKLDKDMNSKLIMWRGSRSHDEDIMEYLDSMLQIADEFKDWKWIFLGQPYFRVQSAFPRKQAIIVDSVDTPRFYDFLNTMNAEIGVVPLKDNPFNRSKSNIAWQEFSYMGAATLAPDWPEWQKPGVTHYADKKTFVFQMRKLIKSQIQRRNAANSSWSYIENNLQLKQVNALRRKILLDLVGTKDELQSLKGNVQDDIYSNQHSGPSEETKLHQREDREVFTEASC